VPTYRIVQGIFGGRKTLGNWGGVERCVGKAKEVLRGQYKGKNEEEDAILQLFIVLHTLKESVEGTLKATSKVDFTKKGKRRRKHSWGADKGRRRPENGEAGGKSKLWGGGTRNVHAQSLTRVQGRAAGRNLLYHICVLKERGKKGKKGGCKRRAREALAGRSAIKQMVRDTRLRSQSERDLLDITNSWFLLLPESKGGWVRSTR